MMPFQAMRLRKPTVGDPYFSSVSLLLHFDGTNGSTTFTDSSSSPKTVTVGGAAAISATSPLYGTGTALVGNGSAGNYFQAPSQAFGTADFTLEFWAYLNNFTSSPTFVDNRVVTPTADLAIYNSSGGTITFYAAGANRASTGSNMTLGVWTHFALSRVSGVSRFFMGGVQQGSNYTDTNNYNHTTLRFGANYLGNNTMNGNVEDVRITLGVGRYSANFTPPTAAFPNS